MRHTWVRRVGIVALVGVMVLSVGLIRLVFMAGSAGAAPPVKDDALAGVTQNWDKKLPSTSRFTVLADFSGAAVRDNETGLVWEQSPEAINSTWEFSLIECANKSVGGRKGWRLPSMPELASLIDPSVGPPNPSLPLNHPFANVQATRYWSATKVATFIEDQWYVDFLGGTVRPDVADNYHFFFWCVRGPMNVNQY